MSLSLPLYLVLGDHAVPDGDDAVGVLGNIVLVRHQDDGVAFGMQAVEEGHDLIAGL